MSINLNDYNFNNRTENSDLNSAVEKQYNDFKLRGGEDAGIDEKIAAMIEETWAVPHAIKYFQRPDFEPDANFTDEIKANKLYDQGIPYSRFEQFLKTESEDEWDYLAREFRYKDETAKVLTQMSTTELLGYGLVVGAAAPESIFTGVLAGSAVKAAQAARLAKVSKSLNVLQKMSPKLAVRQALSQKATLELAKGETYAEAMKVAKRTYNYKNIMADMGVAGTVGAGENALLTSMLVATNPTIDTEDKYKQIAVDALFGGVLGAGIGGVVSKVDTNKANISINEYDKLIAKRDSSLARIEQAKTIQNDFMDKYKLERNSIDATKKAIDDMMKNSKRALKAKETQKANLDGRATIVNMMKKQNAAIKQDQIRQQKMYMLDPKVSDEAKLASANSHINSVENYHSHVQKEIALFKKDNEKEIALGNVGKVNKLKSLEKEEADLARFLQKAKKDPVKALTQTLEAMDNKELIDAQFVDEKILYESLDEVNKREYDSVVSSISKLKEKTKELGSLRKSNILDYSFDDAVSADMGDPLRKETFDYLLTLQKNDDIQGKSIHYYDNEVVDAIENDAEKKSLLSRTVGVGRGYTEKLGVFQNYLDRTTNFGKTANDIFPKIFRMSARKDHGVVDESVEEAKNTLEASFNYRFQTVYSKYADAYGSLRGTNTGKMSGNLGRLEFSELIIKIGDEMNMGSTRTLDGLADQRMKDMLMSYIDEHKKLTSDLLQEAKKNNLSISELVIDNKEFYAPVKWEGQTLNTLAKEFGSKEPLYELFRVAMLRHPENEWMNKSLIEGGNRTYADIFARAFVDNNITRASRTKKVSTPNAEYQLLELEKMLENKKFFEDHNVDIKDAKNVVKALRSKFGQEVSKKGVNKQFNARIKMDYTTELDFLKADGTGMTISVGQLKSSNLEELMGRYNSSLAGAIAFSQKLGIKNYDELKDKMSLVRNEIIDLHGDKSKQIRDFDKNYDLESENSVVDHLYTGRAMYESSRFVQNVLKYNQAVGLMMLPLTMMNEMFSMAAIGGYKSFIKNSPPYRAIMKKIAKGEADETFLTQLQEAGIIMNHYTNKGATAYSEDYSHLASNYENLTRLEKAEYKLDTLSNFTNRIPQELDHAMRNTAGAMATERAFDLGIFLRNKKIAELKESGLDNARLKELEEMQLDYETQFNTKHKGHKGDRFIINEDSLGEFGLEADDLINFTNYIQSRGDFAEAGYINKKPVLVGYSLDRFAADDIDLYTKVVRGYTKKVIDSVIQQNYKGQSMPWLENHFISKMIFQFRTHPMQSLTNHLRKYTDFSSIPQAKRLGFYLMNITMAGALVETARVGLGSLGYSGKEKEEYLNANLSIQRMLMQGFGKSSYVGILGDALGGAVHSVTDKGLFNDGFSYNVNSVLDNPTVRLGNSIYDLTTGGIGQALHSLTQGEVGKPMTNQKLRSAMSAFPFLALPMAKDAVSQTIFDGRQYNAKQRLFEEDEE